MSSPSYADAPAEMLAEIVREAEARLTAQLTAAVAADQRAMTFAGLMLAAAAGLTGAALGAAPEATLTVPVIVSAFGLFIAAMLAVISARPIPWDFVGNQPNAWLGDIGSKVALHDSLAAMAEHYDEMISENDSAIAACAFWLRMSMGSALLSIFVGVVAAATRAL